MAPPSRLARELYMALLNSKNGKIGFESISRMTGIDAKEAKARLERLRVVRMTDEVVFLDNESWASLAERAVREGVPLRRIAETIPWQRFEVLAEEALARHGFETKRGYRFRSEGRRWEIDVMGLRGTDLVCFDCKQWKTWGKESAVLRSAEEHASRVEALSRVQAKPKDFEAVWNAVKIYPALVTLLDIDRRVSAGCFVVPVSNLNSFLDDFYDLRGLVKPFKAEAVEENPRRG